MEPEKNKTFYHSDIIAKTRKFVNLSGFKIRFLKCIKQIFSLVHYKFRDNKI